MWVLMNDEDGVPLSEPKDTLMGLTYVLNQRYLYLKTRGRKVALDTVCNTIYLTTTQEVLFSIAEVGANGRLKSVVCKCR